MYAVCSVTVLTVEVIFCVSSLFKEFNCNLTELKIPTLPVAAQAQLLQPLRLPAPQYGGDDADGPSLMGDAPAHVHAGQRTGRHKMEQDINI